MTSQKYETLITTGKIIILVFIWCIIVTAGLRACDYEAEQQQAKYDQWENDRQNGKPYTNFSE